MREIETIIIGAGISGLYFANMYKGDYLILEKEDSIGGLCRTFYNEDYVWDYAGHFFHFASDEMKKYFEDKIKNEDLVKCKKNTKIYYNDLMIDYPFQKNIHQLNKDEFIECLYDLYFKESKIEYSSFLDMLYGKFGESITEKFLKPYNEKLYACELNYLDEKAMGRFFPYADLEDVIGNMKKCYNKSYNDYFDYPKKGAQVFVEALSKDLNCNKIITSCEVLSIDKENKIIKTSKGDFKFKYLVNTASFKELLDMTKLDSSELSCNKVLVFNIGFDKVALNNQIHWIYYPDKMVNFYRVGFYNNILGADKLSIYVEIGFNSSKEINIEQEFVKTLDNLQKVGVITEHKVVAYNSVIINPAYVHVSTRGQKYVKETREYLMNMGIYSVGRYGAWTYCSMEDAMLQAGELARNLNNLIK